MMKRKIISRFCIVSVLGLMVYACASVGTPTGGYTDRIPPVPLAYYPPNGSTDFSAKKITVIFNERIKFSDLRKNLIVSPHLDLADYIKPTSAMPSKELTIDLSKVELAPNTTYTINFSNSVTDFNEGNRLPNFKYVFSTGPKIDSLVIGGVVEDAYEGIFNPKTSILLYRMDSTYTDSAVFKERPLYFSRLAGVKDSTFRIDNITPGTYQLFALVDEGENMKYDPLKDQIAFFPRPIVLNDSTFSTSRGYMLRTAMADAPYKVYQPANVQKGLIQIPLSGFTEEYTVERVSPSLPDEARDMFIYSEKRDTLYYWSSAEEKDSIVFFVKKGDEITDTLNAKIRKASSPEFSLKVSQTSIHMYDNIRINANKPIAGVDTAAIRFVSAADSTHVPFSVKIDSLNRSSAEIVFSQTPASKYLLDIYPGAFTSVLGEETKDTVLRTVSTRTMDDYGNLRVNPVSFDSYPMIIQLLDISKKTVVREKVIRQAGSVTFDLLPPGTYFLRIIFDANDNGRWDTVDFLHHRQPERIKYMKDPVEIRAMWSEDLDW